MTLDPTVFIGVPKSFFGLMAGIARVKSVTRKNACFVRTGGRFREIFRITKCDS